VTLTEAQLVAWGEHIGATVQTPVFFALSGDLGAGKSVLARAIARGAGVHALMPSPTFNLLFRYDARNGTEVVHMDLYRIERPDDVWELGWRDLGAENEITLVEWPERAGPLLPPDRWNIRLDITDADARTVTIRPVGAVPDLPQPSVQHARRD
jgi:tRNA threonylcarbamoyladenosine biosynthesis protein TsaE